MREWCSPPVTAWVTPQAPGDISSAFALLSGTGAVPTLADLPHINLPPDLPGISSAMAFRPETAVHLRALAETLLRGPNTLTSAEREAIAAFVSKRNDCTFCYLSHRAASAHHTGGD